MGQLGCRSVLEAQAGRPRLVFPSSSFSQENVSIARQALCTHTEGSGVAGCTLHAQVVVTGSCHLLCCPSQSQSPSPASLEDSQCTSVLWTGNSSFQTCSPWRAGTRAVCAHEEMHGDASFIHLSLTGSGSGSCGVAATRFPAPTGRNQAHTQAEITVVLWC